MTTKSGRVDVSGDYLRSLGADIIVPRQELAEVIKRPLESERWAGCIDNVGGEMLAQVLQIMQTRKPKSLSVCTLLNKPSRREIEVGVTWTGFDIPDEFVIGYGIDYAQQGRNLPHIGFVRRT